MLAGMALLIAGAGCVTAPPNSQRKACSDACVESKNRCLIAATSADAVQRCDEDHRACVAPCLALPAHVAGGRHR